MKKVFHETQMEELCFLKDLILEEVDKKNGTIAGVPMTESEKALIEDCPFVLRFAMPGCNTRLFTDKMTMLQLVKRCPNTMLSDRTILQERLQQDKKAKLFQISQIKGLTNEGKEFSENILMDVLPACVAMSLSKEGGGPYER